VKFTQASTHKGKAKGDIMPIVVNTNTSSLFAQRALGSNAMQMQRSIEKLSTGSRINRAGDDAAGLSISEGMTSDIRGFQKAKQNVGDGISLIQTAEGALSIVQDNVQRIRELTVQAINGTNSADEKDAIQREINERVTTIEDIASSTKFNGVAIINGGTTKTLQTGANNGESTSIVLTGATAAGVQINIDTTSAGSIGESAAFALSALHVGGSVNAQDGSTSTVTSSALTGIDYMINNLSRMRSYLGASQNALESKSEYLDVAIENSSAARSRIKDVDVASESSHLLKNQILQQAAATMLTQANATPQLALNLLP
jgi:flagellin